MEHNISFFVSSTFKDMQGERDALHRSVIPDIREFAKSYGYHVDFVDLRWGISTEDLEEDRSTQKILSVCLNEIENCSPYQIVILGERYGWIPSANQLRDASGKKGFSLEDELISVTELEIQYGLWLNRNSLDKCIFCMRNSVDKKMLTSEQQKFYFSDQPEDVLKMQKLKEKIYQTPGVHILEYDIEFENPSAKYQTFSEKLTCLIKEILKKEWGDTPCHSWIEREKTEERLISEELIQRFSGRESLLHKLEDTTEHGLTVVAAQEGSGTTSVFAKLGENLRAKGKRVKNVYCGKGLCLDVEQLIKILCAEVGCLHQEKEFQKIEPGTGEGEYWKERWDQIAASYNGDTIYLLIDGIHHLSENLELSVSDLLPGKGYGGNIKFLISSKPDVNLDPIAIEKTGYWCEYVDLDVCTREDLYKIITSRLKAEHKQLGEKVMHSLLEHPMSKNMVCLELMLQNILNLDQRDYEKITEMENSMDGNQAIDTYLCEFIEEHPKTEFSLIKFWLQRSLDILAEHDSDELNYLYYMFSCLVFPVNGMTMEELYDMEVYLKNSGRTGNKYWLNWWQEVRFFKLRSYLGNMLRKNASGRYVVTHEQIRSVLLGTKEMQTLVVGPMLYFASLEDGSILKQENLLASYLHYSTNPKFPTEKEREERFFFGFLTRTYEMVNNDDKEQAKKGRIRLERMANGILSNFMSYDGRKRTKVLCDILKRRAAEGMPPADNGIAPFTLNIARMWNRQSTYQKSIVLMYYSAILAGYMEFEEANGAIQYRQVAMFCTELCEYYHNIRVELQTEEGLLKPVLDWTQVRTKVSQYINAFEKDKVFRNFYCNRIILLDAENNLEENYDYSYKNIIDSEKYNKDILIHVHKDDQRGKEIVTNYYLQAMLHTAHMYLTLSYAVRGTEREKYRKTFHFDAKHTVEKAIRKLKRYKMIKEPLDLTPLLRIRYFTTLYQSLFYNESDKQEQTDNMWEIYKVYRSQKEWMYNREIRKEISECGKVLIEYLVQGYIPTEYQKNKSDYLQKLLRYEGIYMHAGGHYDFSAKGYYEQALLNILFILDEVNYPEEARRKLCEDSIQTIKERIDFWGNVSDEYIIRMKWLLEWMEVRRI